MVRAPHIQVLVRDWVVKEPANGERVLFLDGEIEQKKDDGIISIRATIPWLMLCELLDISAIRDRFVEGVRSAITGRENAVVCSVRATQHEGIFAGCTRTEFELFLADEHVCTLPSTPSSCCLTMFLHCLHLLVKSSNVCVM